MNFRLSKIWGIPIELHSSWFVIFIIQTWILATGFFRFQYPHLGLLSNGILSAFTSLLMFASVLAHELGHAWVARRNQIRVRRVTLFIFGGIAEIEQEPESPGVEFRVAVAGPLVNLVLAGCFWALWKLDAPMPILTAPCVYLITANLALLVFNLAPGFPLDGGRMLRAGLWKLTGNPQRATKISGFAGLVIAVLLVALAFYLLFALRLLLDALWTGVIGYFLFQAAASAIQQANQESLLSGLSVRQVMQRDIVHIPALLPLHQAVEQWIIPSEQSSFFVTNSEGVHGVLTRDTLRKIPMEHWQFLNAAQAMKPLSDVLCIEAGAEVRAGLNQLEVASIQSAPVIDDGQVVGLFSKQRVEHFLQIKKQLGQ